MSDSQPAQVIPGCVLILLQLSRSMRKRFQGRKRPVRKIAAARLFVDATLEMLGRIHDAGALPETFEIAVVGYASLPKGSPIFFPLLPGTDEKLPFRSMVEMKKLEVSPRPAGPKHWIGRLKLLGKPVRGLALVHAYRIVASWLQRHPDVNPPLVVHCHDGLIARDLPARAEQSITLLGNRRGQVVLHNAVFSEHYPVRRSLTVNSWSPRVLRQHFQGTSIQDIEAPEAGADAIVAVPFLDTRLLWMPKQGNSDDEWEDACAVGALSGVAAICDGAGEGIFSKAWANHLASRFVREQPDIEDALAFSAWLQDCRMKWREEIQFPTLRWSQQNKVIETGAAATFLAFRLDPTRPGEQSIGWRAWAFGDSCLFWVRDHRLLAGFPIVHSQQFTLGPVLLRTKTQGGDPVPLRARGRCRPGDVFILTTDAVAQQLLQSSESSGLLDWERFATIDANDWKDEIAALRQDQRIVNDDCTLLYLRIGGDGAGSP